jgi:hypothetical protein
VRALRAAQVRGDDDDELQTGATVLSLRCPLLGGRVRTPARFVEVPGLAVFDLAAFLASAARTRKWQCPISMTHSTVQQLQVRLRDCGPPLPQGPGGARAAASAAQRA